MTRRRAAQITPVLTHLGCQDVAAVGLHMEDGVLPAPGEQRFVLHARIGASPIELPELRRRRDGGNPYDLPRNQAYELRQRDVYVRPYQVPGFESEVRLHLFGVVSCLKPVHSLGSTEAWFPEGEELLITLLRNHVHGGPAEAFGLCHRPNLAKLHAEIFAAILEGGCTIQDKFPGWHYIFPDDEAPAGSLAS